MHRPDARVPLPSLLGRFMRQRRRQLGMSLQKLGGMVGAHASTLSRIETGQALPSPAVTRRLAAALKVDEAIVRSWQEALVEEDPKERGRKLKALESLVKKELAKGQKAVVEKWALDLPTLREQASRPALYSWSSELAPREETVSVPVLPGDATIEELLRGELSQPALLSIPLSLFPAEERAHLSTPFGLRVSRQAEELLGGRLRAGDVAVLSRRAPYPAAVKGKERKKGKEKGERLPPLYGLRFMSGIVLLPIDERGRVLQARAAPEGWVVQAPPIESEADWKKRVLGKVVLSLRPNP